MYQFPPQPLMCLRHAFKLVAEVVMEPLEGPEKYQCIATSLFWYEVGHLQMRFCTLSIVVSIKVRAPPPLLRVTASQGLITRHNARYLSQWEHFNSAPKVIAYKLLATVRYHLHVNKKVMAGQITEVRCPCLCPFCLHMSISSGCPLFVSLLSPYVHHLRVLVELILSSGMGYTGGHGPI